MLRSILLVRGPAYDVVPEVPSTTTRGEPHEHRRNVRTGSLPRPSRFKPRPSRRVPQKRKVGADGPADPAAAPKPARRASESSQTNDADSPKNEYETGRVTCESCGESISFRDEATKGFTVKHWDLHRQEWCVLAARVLRVLPPESLRPSVH